MEHLLEKFSEDYSSRVAAKLTDIQDKRDAYNPVLFIFLGDKLQDSARTIKKIIDENWSNSSGVAYLSFSSEDGINEPWLNYVKIEKGGAEEKELREGLYKNFIADETKLLEVNEELNKVKNKILEGGPLFPYFQKLSITVITRAEDPLNALVVPVVLLMKDRMQNTFQMINTELFELLEERGILEEEGFGKAVAMSFFKEIEHAQKSGYKFEEEIKVHKGGIKYKITNNSSPIFDMIYMLSDRNRRGFLLQDGLKKNAQIAAYICMLKNGNSNSDVGRYSDSDFKGNLGSSERQVYASAGLSMVKRPNKAIAYTIISSCYELLLKDSRDAAQMPAKDMLGLLGLDDATLKALVDSMVNTRNKIDLMTGIMCWGSRSSTGHLKSMNLRGFERELYGDACGKFFSKNFSEPAYGALEKATLKETFRKCIYENIVDNPRYGLFAAYEWTKEESVPKRIADLARAVESEMKALENKAVAAYNKKVKLPFYQIFPWLRQKALYKAKENFVSEIYAAKVDILYLELKKRILSEYEEEILRINSELKEQVMNAEEIFKEIKVLCDKELESADEYVGGNIKSYYNLEVVKANDRLAQSQKEALKESLKELKNGGEAFCEKLCEACRESLLMEDKFLESFEEEMHNRANASVVQGDNNIIAWDDLYKRIYTTLENNAEININILDFNLNRIPEEKYFFGNYNSNFIQYAFQYDSNSRNYKLGCVNERSSKGIEKLKLMGGFYLTNLTFYNECLMNYNHFKEHGYKLHGIEIEEGEVKN